MADISTYRPFGQTLYLPGDKPLLKDGKVVVDAYRACCPCMACYGIAMSPARTVTITNVVNAWVGCVSKRKWIQEPDWDVINTTWTLCRYGSYPFGESVTGECIYAGVSPAWAGWDASPIGILGVYSDTDCTVLVSEQKLVNAHLRITIYSSTEYIVEGSFAVSPFGVPSAENWFWKRFGPGDLCIGGDTVASDPTVQLPYGSFVVGKNGVATIAPP